MLRRFHVAGYIAPCTNLSRGPQTEVLGIYVIVSWIALQLVDVLANNYGLPD